MNLSDFIRRMPKVEIHVHLEGSVQPETLLKLAKRNNIALPADSVEGIRRWYIFTDFPHFIEIYMKISECIRTSDDIELVAREFLEGQAAQNIRYSEVTYTPHTHFVQKGLAFSDQIAALNRAREWGERNLGVKMGLVLDIARGTSAGDGLWTAERAVEAMDQGVVALGLGGPEVGYPPERYTAAFEFARAAGLPAVPHAGETVGPESIWGALKALHAVRIGHGVRCLEDPALVEELRTRQIPLEVNPTSNICLGVFPTFEDHPLPRLLAEGLYVTINSDDPPMFNTTLTDEYLKSASAFGFDVPTIQKLVMNAVQATLLDNAQKSKLEAEFLEEFAQG